MSAVTADAARHAGFVGSIDEINEVRAREPQRIGGCWPPAAAAASGPTAG